MLFAVVLLHIAVGGLIFSDPACLTPCDLSDPFTWLGRVLPGADDDVVIGGVGDCSLFEAKNSEVFRSLTMTGDDSVILIGSQNRTCFNELHVLTHLTVTTNTSISLRFHSCAHQLDYYWQVCVGRRGSSARHWNGHMLAFSCKSVFFFFWFLFQMDVCNLCSSLSPFHTSCMPCHFSFFFFVLFLVF
jgi:hypothetical protein